MEVLEYGKTRDDLHTKIGRYALSLNSFILCFMFYVSYFLQSHLANQKAVMISATICGHLLE